MEINSETRKVDVTVVGLSGPARAGKDTAAEWLLKAIDEKETAAREHVCTILPMALPLKKMLATLYTSIGMEPKQIQNMIHGEDKDRVSPIFGVTPRLMMQTLGTEWGRQQIRDDFWLQVQRARMRSFVEWNMVPHVPQKFIILIPDIRFNNEAELCDYVIKITRESAPDVEAHASEAGLFDDLIDFNITNNGTKAELAKKLEAVANTVLQEDAKSAAYQRAVHSLRG